MKKYSVTTIKNCLIAVFALCLMGACGTKQTSQTADESAVWDANLPDGMYRNPIIYADYSDPDVCRVGEDYYLTASSFNCMPGLPILHSRDLVNWRIIGHALREEHNTLQQDNGVAHGCGVWAPAIRHHNGRFYIFWGDPDKGAFMVSAEQAEGPWTEPVLVKPGKGIIDTCPLWDEDGRVYMVHAYAGSRAGLKSVIAVCELSADATKAITPSRIIYDGHNVNPTCEGPKFYKRAGKYYIFLPAGGVPTGWQVVMKADNVYGPYEAKTVMHQAESPTNGPHQGGWVETPQGEDWFIHFQDIGAYGRVAHLQPMTWKGDWPVIGVDSDGDGIGEPVTCYQKPKTSYTGARPAIQENDEFDQNSLGLQWQWQANMDTRWYYCNATEGKLRLYAHPDNADSQNLWDAPNLLLQKTTAPNFTATTKVSFTPSEKYTGERGGLVVMGRDYAAIILENTPQGILLKQVECLKADKDNAEQTNEAIPLALNEVYLRVSFAWNGEKIAQSEGGHDQRVMCSFSYSEDGEAFKPLGKEFQAREGQWIGAKVGLFCNKPHMTINDTGWMDVDWFRLSANSYTEKMVESHGLGDFYCNRKHKESLQHAGWDYVSGLVANAVLKAWKNNPQNEHWYQAVKAFADNSVVADGSGIRNEKGEDALRPSNIDDLPAGNIFFTLHQEEMKRGNTTEAEKYKRAATVIRNKLKNNHQRIATELPGAGGFFHKAVYPNQMWLDGLYMGATIYAGWQHHFGKSNKEDNMQSWSDIAHQFKTIHRYTYNPDKQLNYHAWSATPEDENSFWARKEGAYKGCSNEFWARGMGWYFAALTDVLEYMPQNHADYPAVLAIYQQVAEGLKRWQDEESGVWYQLLQYDNSKTADGIGDEWKDEYYNKGGKPNYLEASASSIFTYAYLKGIRLGLLDKATYMPVAQKAYRGLLATFIREKSDNSRVDIIQSCASAGLGPAKDPSRTGTSNYYLEGKDVTIVSNEGKAIGSFIMAATEWDMATSHQ